MKNRYFTIMVLSFLMTACGEYIDIKHVKESCENKNGVLIRYRGNVNLHHLCIKKEMVVKL